MTRNRRQPGRYESTDPHRLPPRGGGDPEDMDTEYHDPAALAALVPRDNSTASRDGLHDPHMTMAESFLDHEQLDPQELVRDIPRRRS